MKRMQTALNRNSPAVRQYLESIWRDYPALREKSAVQEALARCELFPDQQRVAEVRRQRKVMPGHKDKGGDGLVLHYTFDEDLPEVENVSGMDNRGVRHEAKWIREGRRGGALSFGPDNFYVRTPTLSGMENAETQNAFTVTAWIRTGYSGPLRIATYADSTKRAWALGIHPASHELCLIAYDKNGIDKAMAQSQPLNRFAGQWIHVAGTYDGSAEDPLKVYVNGSNATDSTTPGAFRTLDDGPRPLYIGVFWNASGQLTGGYGDIDDVRVYSRALTQDELAALAAE